MLLNNSRALLGNVSFTNNHTGIIGDSSSLIEIGTGGVIFSGNTTDDSPETLVP